MPPPRDATACSSGRRSGGRCPLPWRTGRPRIPRASHFDAPSRSTIVAPFIRFDASNYVRSLVAKSERWELRLLCWRPGQGTSIHGHGGSACAFRILRAPDDARLQPCAGRRCTFTAGRSQRRHHRRRIRRHVARLSPLAPWVARPADHDRRARTLAWSRRGLRRRQLDLQAQRAGITDEPRSRGPGPFRELGARVRSARRAPHGVIRPPTTDTKTMSVESADAASMMWMFPARSTEAGDTPPGPTRWA